MKQPPSIGRIVHYKLSDYDVREIRAERDKTGVTGNPVDEGQVVPVIVTAFFPSPDGRFYVNGKAILVVCQFAFQAAARRFRVLYDRA